MTELSGCPACTQTGAVTFLPLSSSSTMSSVLIPMRSAMAGTHQDRIVPGELVHRLGQFLQPAVVGELAVVDGGIAAEVDLDGLLIRRWPTSRIRRSSPQPVSARTLSLRSIRRAVTCARTRRSPRPHAASSSKPAQCHVQPIRLCPESIATNSYALFPSYSGAISGCTMLTVPS